MRIFTDIVYNEYGQALDIYLPESGLVEAIFVYFHGGGLEVGSKSGCRHFVPYLTAHNMAVVSADYRMYPSEKHPENHAKYPDFIEDAADCVAWVMAHAGEYCSCDKIFVGGSSAGGYLSMMLCFNEAYLGKHSIKPTELAGFIHDAGQPTSHFNVLRERGIDTRRLIVDETAPLYFVGHNGNECAPMIFLVSDNDIPNRYEQTELMIGTMKHFGYDMSKVELKLLHGGHCHQIHEFDENGDNVFGKLIREFVSKAL